jgi:hypothetical protein
VQPLHLNGLCGGSHLRLLHLLLRRQDDRHWACQMVLDIHWILVRVTPPFCQEDIPE